MDIETNTSAPQEEAPQASQAEAEVAATTTTPPPPPPPPPPPEDVPGPGPAGAVIAEELSVLWRFFHWLLGKDSRMGRFMRRALRLLATVVGLFALGLLAGYFLLYLPAQAQLDASRATLAQRDAALQGLQTQAQTLTAARDLAQKQATAAANDLAAAKNRNALLLVVNDIATARMNLALKDGAKAMNSLTQAQADLAAVQTFLSLTNKADFDEIQNRLTVMISVVVSDPQVALSDMDNLYTRLLAIDASLFGKN